MADAPPAVVELRPMGIGDILDATFRLYKTSFLPFLVIALVAYLPYALYTLGIGLAYGPPGAEVDPLTQTTQMEYPGGGEDVGTYLLLDGVGSVLFMIIVFPLAQAALVYNISGVILGERISAGTAFGRAAGRFLPLFGTQLLAGIVVGLGFLLLIVPGIIFGLWFMLVAPIVVLERMGGTRGLSRSRELMKGNLGKGFMLSIILTLLGAIVGYGVGLVLAILPLPAVFFQVGLLLMQAVILPIQTAPIILLYYELRVRKEAFDLQRLAETVGSPQAPPPVS
jgi:hypothetical protein